MRLPSLNQRRPAKALAILCFTAVWTVLLALSVASLALAQHGGSGHGGASGSHGFGGGHGGRAGHPGQGRGGKGSNASSQSAHQRFASTFGRFRHKSKFRVCEDPSACGGEAGYVPCSFWHRRCPPTSKAPASDPPSTGPPSSSNRVNDDDLFARGVKTEARGISISKIAANPLGPT